MVEFPTCTDRPTFDKWMQVARICGGINKTVGFCVDCTPNYQRKMIGRGDCNNSHVRFRTDSDGLIEGFVPPKSK